MGKPLGVLPVEPYCGNTNGNMHLLVLLSSVIVFEFCFLMVIAITSRYKKSNTVIFTSNIISTLHAFIASYGALQLESIFKAGPEAAFTGNCLRDYYLMVTMGYIIFDLLINIFINPTFDDPVMLVHHIVIPLAFALGVHLGLGTVYMGTLLMNEMSTPFLNLRWFLLEFELQNSSWYTVNGVLFAGTFFVCRVFATAYVIYHIGYTWTSNFHNYWHLISPPVRTICFFLSSLAGVQLIINVIWFQKIVQHIRRRFTKSN